MPKNRIRRGRPNRNARRGRGRFPRVPRDAVGGPAMRMDRYNLDRTFIAATVTLAAGSNSYGALTLSYQSLPSNIRTLLGLFDLVQFHTCQVIFVPHWTVNASGTVSDEEIPQLALAPQFDDAVSPTTFDSVLAIGGVAMTIFNRTIRRTFPVHGVGVSSNVASSPTFYNYTIEPRGVMYNSVAFSSGLSLQIPIAKWAVGSAGTAPAGYPANGRFDIYYRLKAAFIQRTA